MIKKSIKEQIKEYFLQNPTIKLRVRQIERTVKVPLPSVIRYTKELEKEKILKSTELVNITVYSADRNSKDYITEKRVFNIKQIHKSGLINALIKEYSNPTIIVFGSFSKGEDTEKSDVDLYIETQQKKRINLTKHENFLQRTIQVFKHKNIHEIKNKELANNILNGITMNGFIEVY